MKFNASALDRVMGCAGSYLLEQQYPYETNGAALEGRAAAKVAELCLLERKLPSEFLGQQILDVWVDQEMITAVEKYTAFCYSLNAERGGVEDRGELEVMSHTVVCIPDFWAVSGFTLHIVDFKYGHGWVFPEENWQCIAGAIIKATPGIRDVQIHICQPRANRRSGGPVWSWGFNAELLRNYRNQIDNQVRLAVLPGALCQSGPWCRYCKHIINCPTNAHAAGDCMDAAGISDSFTPTPNEVAIELSRLETAAARIKHRFTALEAHGLALIKSGQLLSGYEARQTMSALKWTVDAITAGDEMGIDLRKPEEAITPTQAIDRKLIDATMIDFMAKRELQGHKLKLVDLDAIRSIING